MNKIAPINQLTNRLLQSDEPSIRWKVRVNVLGENPDSEVIKDLQQEIKNSPRVEKLLAPHLNGGNTNVNVYAKWQGIHWVLATLADIGYPPGDPDLMPLKDRLLDTWLRDAFYTEFEVDSQAKAYGKEGVPVMQGRHRRCASQQGNTLYMLLKLGLRDERTDNLVERLLHWQWPDGGWNCDKNPDASHSSFMETLLPLRGLALYAAKTGNASAQEATKRAAEIFLKRYLYKSQSTGAVIHPEFTMLHYPLYWHYDILGGLKVLKEAGFINDPRCADALNLMHSKQLEDGGWPAEKSYYKVSDGIQLGAENLSWGGTGKKKMNEWVTADALYVLKGSASF